MDKVTVQLLCDVGFDGIVFQVSIDIYLTILLLSLIVTNTVQSETRPSISGRNFSFSSTVPSLIATAYCGSAVVRGRFIWRIQDKPFFCECSRAFHLLVNSFHRLVIYYI